MVEVEINHPDLTRLKGGWDSQAWSLAYTSYENGSRTTFSDRLASSPLSLLGAFGDLLWLSTVWLNPDSTLFLIRKLSSSPSSPNSPHRHILPPKQMLPSSFALQLPLTRLPTAQVPLMAWENEHALFPGIGLSCGLCRHQ